MMVAAMTDIQTLVKEQDRSDAELKAKMEAAQKKILILRTADPLTRLADRLRSGEQPSDQMIADLRGIVKILREDLASRRELKRHG